MLKKAVAVCLSAITVFGAAGTTASAASVNLFGKTVSVGSESMKNAVENAAATLVNAHGRVKVSDALFENIIEKTGKNPTVDAIKQAMSGYAVLDTRELPETARKIAENAEYKILKGNVVYIVVSIEENPELFDLITLCHTSAALLEKQNEFIADSEETDLIVNDYSHIVGELALHCAVYALTKAAGGADENSALNGHFESAKEAELNQNETRGAGLIQIFGQVLTFFYKLIGGTFGV